MIGIIGAMQIEVESLLSKMEAERTETYSGVAFHIGRLNGAPCVLAQCGPGKVNAAVCTQIMLMRWDIRAVINTGVAGGIGSAVKIGDLMLAESVVQHDVDTTALGDPPCMVSGVNLVHFPADTRLNEALADAARATGYSGGIHIGVIVTGDQFIAEPNLLHKAAAPFSALACEMEGGAIGQVCVMNGVPFAVARAISDNADSTAHVDFFTFATESAHKTSDLLFAALPNL